jgi:hypothetical protein
MKKFAVIMILLACVCFVSAAEEPCQPKSFSITVGAGGRTFSEELFKEVYKSTPIVFSLDVAMRIMKSIEVFLHTDYLSVDGELTFTHEPTTFKMIPIELGGRFLFNSKNPCKQKMFPYLGAGIGYYMVKEESGGNPEDTDEKRIGFFAEGGFRILVTKSVFFDAKFKYIAVNSENDVNMGGLAFLGGIGFSF